MNKTIKFGKRLCASAFILSTGASASHELVRVPPIEDSTDASIRGTRMSHRKCSSLDEEMINNSHDDPWAIYYSFSKPDGEAIDGEYTPEGEKEMQKEIVDPSEDIFEEEKIFSAQSHRKDN